MTRSHCNGLAQVLVDACAKSGITPIEFHSLWLWTQEPVAHTFVSGEFWAVYLDIGEAFGTTGPSLKNFALVPLGVQVQL